MRAKRVFFMQRERKTGSIRRVKAITPARGQSVSRNDAVFPGRFHACFFRPRDFLLPPSRRRRSLGCHIPHENTTPVAVSVDAVVCPYRPGGGRTGGKRKGR